MNSRIIFEDVKIYAYHGVLPEERTLGTYYLLNLEITSNLWKAAETDDLSDTLNYAEINELLHREMAIPADLMEHAAGRMMMAIKTQYPSVEKIKIRMTKTNPPMRGEMKGVSIELEKSFS